MVKFTCMDVALAAKLIPDRGNRAGGQQAFQCPVHGDQHASLSINPQKDAWICGPCGATGHKAAQGKAWKLAAFLAGVEPGNKRGVLDYLSTIGLLNGTGSSTIREGDAIVAIYDYQDETGKLVYQVVRYKSKKFIQRRPDSDLVADGKGHWIRNTEGWISNLNGVRRVPYHLPDLLVAKDVVVCEGEKDCDNLIRAGIFSTTLSGGAAASSGKEGAERVAEFVRHFQPGQHVIVIPDNDKAGRHHATIVANALRDSVASVRVIALPGLPEKGDVSDFLAGKEPEAAIDEIFSIWAVTPEWELKDPDAVEPFPIDVVISGRDYLKLDIPKREEMVEGLLYTKSLSFVIAPRGVGKTRLSMTLAHQIATGDRKFFEWKTNRARRVLYVDGELESDDLKEIEREMTGGEPAPGLDLIASEFFSKRVGEPLSLANAVHQARFMGLLDALGKVGRRPELIIFDNLSALTYGLDENDNFGQDALLPFLIGLRHQGYAVLLDVHTGWDATHSRGASRREDPLDLVILLSRTTKGFLPPTCKFQFQITKARRKTPWPSALDCELVNGPDGKLEWVFSQAEDIADLAAAAKMRGDDNRSKILAAIGKEAHTYLEIAMATGLAEPTVRRHLNQMLIKKEVGRELRGKTAWWFLVF